jgi:toxin ParE1/3/4
VRIEWTPPAQADLEEIVRYIAHDDIEAAFRQAERIESAAANLRRYSSMGRIGRIAGSRELVVAGTPYLLIYRVAGDRVEVLRIVHGAQSWPPGEAE